MIFRETQKFGQSSLRVLLAIPPVLVLLLLIWQVGLGHRWGRHPMTNGEIVFLFVILALLYARLSTVRLSIVVGESEIRVALKGAFWRTRIAGDEIESARVAHYDALRDYGGYGVRVSKRGRAYIAGGDGGALLALTDGRQILLGSQKPEELTEAIRKAFCINLEA